MLGVCLGKHQAKTIYHINHRIHPQGMPESSGENTWDALAEDVPTRRKNNSLHSDAQRKKSAALTRRLVKIRKDEYEYE
jgi:hypothetical protein